MKVWIWKMESCSSWKVAKRGAIQDVHNLHEQLRLYIYFDEKKMWHMAGFEQMLVSPAKRDQNEMGGLQKRDRFWCASCLWTNEIKTRPLKMEKCQNLRNEIKTRWGDSVNLPYWGHRTNKSRRSHGNAPPPPTRMSQEVSKWLVTGL